MISLVFRFGLGFALLAAQTSPRTSPAPAPAPAPAAQAAPAPAPAPTPAVDEAKVAALGRTIYAQMRAGKVDPTLLSDQMNKLLTPEMLAQQKPLFDQLGDPTALTLVSATPMTAPAGTAYQYTVDFATAQLHLKIFMDREGKVGGFYLTP